MNTKIQQLIAERIALLALVQKALAIMNADKANIDLPPRCGNVMVVFMHQLARQVTVLAKYSPCTLALPIAIPIAEPDALLKVKDLAIQKTCHTKALLEAMGQVSIHINAVVHELWQTADQCFEGKISFCSRPVPVPDNRFEEHRIKLLQSQQLAATILSNQHICRSLPPCCKTVHNYFAQELANAALALIVSAANIMGLDHEALADPINNDHVQKYFIDLAVIEDCNRQSLVESAVMAIEQLHTSADKLLQLANGCLEGKTTFSGKAVIDLTQADIVAVVAA